MRTKYVLLAFFLLISVSSYISGCHSDTKPETQEPVKSDSVDMVYIIDKEDAEVREIPDSATEHIDKYSFGQKLEVVKETGGWLGVKRPDYVDLLIVYISKTATGSELDIPLTDEDLNEPKVYGINDVPEPYENIEISLITKENFYAMKKTAVDHFTADTQAIRKKDGVFTLPASMKTIPFQDKRDSHQYDYLGQFKSLNKYLVMFVWYEAEDSYYDFYDKTTGEKTASFWGFPYLSNDRKQVICVETNSGYDGADIYNYLLINDSDSLYARGSFKNWMPAEEAERFWGSDNCFYLPVLPTVVFWQPSNPDRKHLPPDYNYRYIRIKITGPTLREY